MLVLTRKAQQQIQIGNNIVITILHVKGQAVRVGIEAPRDVRVIRSEINEKTAAAEPVAEAPAIEAPLARRVKARVPGGETPQPQPFSSPTAAPADHMGESHGLFPRLRRRSRALGGDDAAPQCRDRFASPALCGMVARNI
jgi:carbon storage regulator CsrA